MSEKNINLGLAYYEAVKNKNAIAIAQLFHPQIEFSSPMVQTSGRDTVAAAAAGFASVINGLRVKSSFASGDEVMLAYESDFPEPIGTLGAAALMTIKDGLITKLTLFFDSHPIKVNSEALFAQK